MTRSIGFTLALVAALAWSGWTIAGPAFVEVHACRTSDKRWDRMPPIQRRDQAAVRSMDDAVGELGTLGEG